MQQEPSTIDYATPHSIAARPMRLPLALLSCLPGLLAIIAYIAHQYHELPPTVGFLFWPLLAVGLLVSSYCLLLFRIRYRGLHRPWFVSLSLAIHTIIFIVGVPFLLLLLAAAITGNLR